MLKLIKKPEINSGLLYKILYIVSVPFACIEYFVLHVCHPVFFIKFLGSVLSQSILFHGLSKIPSAALMPDAQAPVIPLLVPAPSPIMYR